jgi:hypothetical protein
MILAAWLRSLHEIQQDLFLSRVGVFALNPSRDLFRQDLVHFKRAGRPLPIKSLRRLVIKVGVVHLSLRILLLTVPIVVLQAVKLICYDTDRQQRYKQA